MENVFEKKSKGCKSEFSENVLKTFQWVWFRGSSCFVGRGREGGGWHHRFSDNLWDRCFPSLYTCLVSLSLIRDNDTGGVCTNVWTSSLRFRLTNDFVNCALPQVSSFFSKYRNKLLSGHPVDHISWCQHRGSFALGVIAGRVFHKLIDADSINQVIVVDNKLFQIT